MQLITAVVHPSKVGAVADALQAYGFPGFSVLQAAGSHSGPIEIYRGVRYDPGLRTEAQFELIAPDEEVMDLDEIICKVAGRGAPDGGRVWVTPVNHLVRFSTTAE